MDLYTIDLSPYIAKIMNQTINAWHNEYSCSPIKIAKRQIKAVVLLVVEILDREYIQLWTFAYVRLLNRPYENEVASNEHN